MDTNYEERNKTQIIRVDAKDCFVESKSDSFEIGKVHFEFATYDTSKEKGERQTNHVHIYLDVSEFMCLANEALTNSFHARARHQRANNNMYEPLFESLGGTSVEKLTKRSNPRADGMSLSRVFKIILGKKDDYYYLVADSGAGQADAKGLIVPKFGNNPENHVGVSMSMRFFNRLIIMTKIHYEAWLAAKYMIENSINKTN